VKVTQTQFVAEHGMKSCLPFDVIRIVVVGPGFVESIMASEPGTGGWDD
jgi:hypothetical protein